MKHTWKIIFLLLFLNSCISQFIPQTNETKELLVVEGLITDQPGVNTIKLSRSLPLGRKSIANPVKGSLVTLTDDLGNTFNFIEKGTGTYVSDPSKFQGIIGRFYTLHISTKTSFNNYSFESYPMEMKPVPPIDSVYYEKVSIPNDEMISRVLEGCQIYLNTHDAENKCRFYRWEYAETWKIILPYVVPNNICWVSDNSSTINIKNTSVFAEDKVNRYPLNYISNATDRLKEKYSILVNQYSLNEDEYLYWEKLQNLSEQVGGLYDMIPSAIPSNIYCLDDPNEKVLGYFSVSASTSKRIFIKDYFRGLIDPYSIGACVADTIFGNAAIPDLNSSVWVIIDSDLPRFRVITYNKGCADCTVRGTTIKPDFWKDGK